MSTSSFSPSSSMSSSNEEPISVRTIRLNNLILGHSKATSKTSRAVCEAISREGLLDAFCLLYNECDKDTIKKRDKNINEFVNKYRPIIEETKNLRVNSADFHVKALIGKGYFGNVHLVVEKSTGDVYAMKKIKKSVVTTTQVKEERDIMAGRKSEWITNLQYAFQDPNNLFLIMEYLPGGDLLSLMSRNGPFDEDLTRFYLAELTIAINALHTMGYVHRDIKPENILIDRFGHIKLADFGNAASLNKDGHVISMSPVGTPDYIAPELLQTISTYKLSKSLHDVTCDYWSMGIIGYELICETTPFHEDNVHETYSKILSHCDDSHTTELVTFPEDVKVTKSCKNLIESLVTSPTLRLTYKKIIQHPFFKGVTFETIRQSVPPIIPNLNGDDDISNFEDIERNKGRRSTFVKKSITTTIKSNEFSGKDLPFLGYSFIHMEKSDNDDGLALRSDDLRAQKLLTKVKELQKVVQNLTSEIAVLQQGLLKAEQKAKQMDSQSKILIEAKDELTKMKNRLQEKTIELASCRTEIKTLKSSLKIEEEMRPKIEAKIQEALGATYKKWEKAKSLSDQNYEKQIAEKKTEISSVNQMLNARESELTTKLEECKHLQEKIENYKEMLKNTKDQSLNDKLDFEKNKTNIIETYEQKMIDIRNKLRFEKDHKSRLTLELRDVRTELNDSICSTNNNKEIKLAWDKSIDDMKQRLNREIEVNNNLRSTNASVDKRRSEVEKLCDSLKMENKKLKEELQLIECVKNLNQISTHTSPYETAHGSLTELHVIEEQLRNDLTSAKEAEDIQRKRADKLEQVVAKLEEMAAKFSEPKAVGDMLEKQNEKLEDKLAAVREQLIVERQSARTANLALWKVEKQMEDLQHEKNLTKRRMELTEEKIKRVQNEKGEFERKLKEAQDIIKQREARIAEFKMEIDNLKADIQKEHKMWEKSEQERMKEKSEVVEQLSTVHKLEENIADLRTKLKQVQQKNYTIILENKRLLRDIAEEREKSSSDKDVTSELKLKYKNLQDNYESLKYACRITDQQLTEIEAMLETEQKRNKEKEEKIDKLHKSVREKDQAIDKLKRDLNLEVAAKITAEDKVANLTTELEDMRKNLEDTSKKALNQQQQLIEQTNNLFQAQEKIELLSIDSFNLKNMNDNHIKELLILKEENSRILTDLYLSKEECLKIDTELKEAKQAICELKQEIDQLNCTLAEKENYYLQRDIKSDATLSQHKKLIDYLQLKVEDLSQKKKKTFSDMIFGTGSASVKKENIIPNNVESSILYRTISEELKREKLRNKVLQEQLEKVSSKGYSVNSNSSPRSPLKSIETNSDANTRPKENSTGVIKKDTSNSTVTTTSSRNSTGRRRTYQTHRLELTLEVIDNVNVSCIACHNPIVFGSAYWKCKECKGSVHRKCRSEVKTSCDGLDSISERSCENDEDTKSRSSISAPKTSNDDQFIGKFVQGYHGDLILKTDNHTTNLEINCAYEMCDKIILLGCNSGLYAYNRENESLVHITGIESVNYIAVFAEFSKAILVGASGEYLYQCDLRHLKNRSQANACTKPKLEATLLDLPFANRALNEKWKLVQISNIRGQTTECQAIAATSARIVILKYDWNLEKFKPVRALETATSVSSILFTELTAIVSSDKFFEIELDRYSADEFVDLSDQSLSHTKSCQPIAAFKISSQELLLCFMECGVFVDQFGCRSRPYDLNWQYTPTGFIYREPLLYISHFQFVQVMRIRRSFRNEVSAMPNDESDNENDEPNINRAFLNFYMPTLLGDSGDLNIYALSINKETNAQELYHLDGLKAFKANHNISMDTLASEATCITLGSASIGSTETL